MLSPPEQPRQIALTIGREQAPPKKTRYRLSTAAPLPLWGLELRVPER